MLTLQIQNELETQLLTFAKQEHTTPELFIQKLINQYAAITKKEDFFSAAGLWQDRDITQETLRAQSSCHNS